MRSEHRAPSIPLVLAIACVCVAGGLALLSGPRLAAQRLRDYADSGKHLGPLPSPGVFARHNAVDTPALLPDGTASESSVSRVLAARGTVRSAPALADDIEGVQEHLGGVSTSASGAGRRSGRSGVSARTEEDAR